MPAFPEQQHESTMYENLFSCYEIRRQWFLFFPGWVLQNRSEWQRAPLVSTGARWLSHVVGDADRTAPQSRFFTSSLRLHEQHSSVSTLH